MRNTLKAYERLKREQHIDTLFRKGKAFSVFPLRFVYLEAPRTEEEPAPIRAGFSVPKKKFRKAVARNRIKRLMREAWRLNKATITALVPADKQWHIFLIFTDATLPDYHTVTASMVKGIERLKQEMITPKQV